LVRPFLWIKIAIEELGSFIIMVYRFLLGLPTKEWLLKMEGVFIA